MAHGPPINTKGFDFPTFTLLTSPYPIENSFDFKLIIILQVIRLM